MGLLAVYSIPRSATFLLKTIPVTCWSGGEITYPCSKWKTRRHMTKLTILTTLYILNPTSSALPGSSSDRRSHSLKRQHSCCGRLRCQHPMSPWRGLAWWRGAVYVDLFWRMKVCHIKVPWGHLGLGLKGTPNRSCLYVPKVKWFWWLQNH